MRKLYFEYPTQVLFYNAAQKGWMAGIAYQDIIIDVNYGEAYSIPDIYKKSPWSMDKPIITYNIWISLTKEMVNDRVPGFIWEQGILREQKK